VNSLLVIGQLLKKNNSRKLNMKMPEIIYINTRLNRVKRKWKRYGKKVNKIKH